MSMIDCQLQELHMTWEKNKYKIPRETKARISRVLEDLIVLIESYDNEIWDENKED